MKPSEISKCEKVWARGDAKKKQTGLVAIFDLEPTACSLTFLMSQKSSYIMNSDSCRMPSAERKTKRKKKILWITHRINFYKVRHRKNNCIVVARWCAYVWMSSWDKFAPLPLPPRPLNVRDLVADLPANWRACKLNWILSGRRRRRGRGRRRRGRRRRRKYMKARKTKRPRRRRR